MEWGSEKTNSEPEREMGYTGQSRSVGIIVPRPGRQAHEIDVSWLDRRPSPTQLV